MNLVATSVDSIHGLVVANKFLFSFKGEKEIYKTVYLYYLFLAIVPCFDLAGILLLFR